MMRKNVIICSAILAVSLIFAGCSAKQDVVASKQADQTLQVNKEMQVDAKFRSVSVKSDVPAVRIEPSSDRFAHLTMQSSAPKEFAEHFNVYYKETGDRLEVVVQGKNNRDSIPELLDLIKVWKAELHIQLPSDRYERIDVNTEIGKIEYSGLGAEQLAVKSEVGAIEVADADTGQAAIHNSVGSIAVHNVNGVMDVTNQTGTVQIEVKNVEHNITASSEIGAVTISTERQPENVGLALSSEIGKINTNFAMDYKENSRTSVVGQKGSGGAKIQVDTSIGPIEVNHLESE
ncbi:DUF4097 family beta strand repeat-containing protein [Paenibacillus sp. MSJ-34]|uniref:DUF4097 family beta strand repeat-containing protein n=1 Tax=Paenibacillus sp. MSJ-34 TaxID=2841529 RepID=UPI001C127901|nr:DUF4097 family beta strand repeat-containing protein [Paenibacillus sp. MSJ-34]MBU5441733.1 DUF4097 domain-containing protein [Paenibacillus sp. MSJ-34]